MPGSSGRAINRVSTAVKLLILDHNLDQREHDLYECNTVEPVLQDHIMGHTIVASEDRWALVTGSITLKYTHDIVLSTFCQKYLVFQDRWSFMAVVSHDRFHCICTIYTIIFLLKPSIYIYQSLEI